MSFTPIHAVRGALHACLLLASTLTLSLALLPPALLKRLLPMPAVVRGCDRALMALAGAWVGINNVWIGGSRQTRWDVEGLDGLSPQAWYLVACNHLSAVDIFVLQRVCLGRIPFLKFFLKRELIWVPVIGMAWWALDFPFMRRGKAQGDVKRDLAAARAACEKFRHVPTSVMNFVEGTRATPEKRAADRSPYRHLLKPKVGGLSVVLSTMGEQFDALLDVTLVYPEGTPTFVDLLCGRMGRVVVRVQPRQIPPDLLGMDPATDRARLVRLGRWVEQMWREKDALIESIQQSAGPVETASATALATAPATEPATAAAAPSAAAGAPPAS
ncbi:MAG: acyltransferase [Aquabacterium sp.]